jgi:hypothetical protein
MLKTLNLPHPTEVYLNHPNHRYFLPVDFIKQRHNKNAKEYYGCLLFIALKLDESEIKV